MIDNPHLTTEVVWSGAPPREARLGAIVLHGRDQSPAIVCEQIGDLLGPEVAVAAPAAANRSWYPGSFLAPRTSNEPWVAHALARVDDVSRALTERGVPRSAQVIVGFSQGACVACEYAWTSGQPLAGLIAFTGGLIGPPGTAWQPSLDLASLAVWISGSDDDPWVPAVRMRETVAAFTRAGARAQLQLHASAEHVVREAERAGARAVLAELAAR